MDFPVNFDLTLLLNKKMFQRLCLAKSRIENGKITAIVRGGIPFKEAKTEMVVPHSFKARKEFMKDLKASFEKVPPMGALVVYDAATSDLAILSAGRVVKKPETKISTKYDEKLMENLFPETNHMCLVWIGNNRSDIVEVYSCMTHQPRQHLFLAHPVGNIMGIAQSPAEKAKAIQQLVVQFLKPCLKVKPDAVIFGISTELWEDWLELDWKTLSSVKVNHFKLDDVSMDNLVLAAKSHLRDYNILKESKSLVSYFSLDDSIVCSGLRNTLKALDESLLSDLIISEEFQRTVYKVRDPVLNKDRFVVSENENEDDPIVHGQVQLKILQKEYFAGWLKVRMEGLKCRLTVISTQLRRGRIFAVAVGIAGILQPYQYVNPSEDDDDDDDDDDVIVL